MIAPKKNRLGLSIMTLYGGSNINNAIFDKSSYLLRYNAEYGWNINGPLYRDYMIFEAVERCLNVFEILFL